MKLTEVTTERTFNLEISESELRDLLAVVVFWPTDNENHTSVALDIIYDFQKKCADWGVVGKNRSDYIEDN